MSSTVETVLAAAKAVQAPELPAQHRREAQDYLLAFRSTDSCWAFCLNVLASPKSVDSDLQLFAAQSLRHKLNSHGHKLSPHELEQLRDQLLRTLNSIGTIHIVGKPLLEQQLCLSLCTLVALLPHWSDAVERVHDCLAAATVVTFLRALAEEAASDMRHIVTAGTSSDQLQWCSETRERVRCWAPLAAALMLDWMQQCAGNTAASAHLLPCLGAWVRLGALHALHHDVAVQLVQVVLQALQGSGEEEAQAVAVMLDVPEYAPQRLLNELAPSMAAVAAGACQAALAGDVRRAHSWCRVYAAYASAQPEVLTAPDARGQALREPLLQLCGIPNVWEDEPAALPAIEAWAGLVDTDMAGMSAGGRNLDTDADSDVAGTAFLNSPELAAACQQLQHSLLNAWLTWKQQGSCRSDPTTADNVRNSFCDALVLCCHAMGPGSFMAAAGRAAGLQLPADLQPSDAGSPLGRHDSAEMESVAIWQQQLQLAGEGWRQQAHAAVRTQGAMMMAVCAGESCRRPLMRGSDDAEGPLSPKGPLQQHQHQLLDQQDTVSGQVALQLLVHAAWQLQQLGADATAMASAVVDFNGLLLSFCEATAAWAHPALAACGTLDVARGLLAGLLQLLLGATSQQGCVLAAARGTKALLQAALGLGLGPLHELTPALLRAVQCVESVAAEQELIVALSASLASHWQCAEVLQARLHATKQLLEPLYALLSSVNSQMQQGSDWAAVAGWADPQLAHHLSRLRVLLDIKLLGGSEDGAHMLGSCSAACLAAANGATAQAAAVNALPRTDGSPAHAQEQQQQQYGQESQQMPQQQQQQQQGLLEQVQLLKSALQPSAQQPVPTLPQQQEQKQQQQAAASVGLQQVLQLLLRELWPLLHTLCMRGASGRFLHALAKCCTAVLRVGGAAIPAPVLDQFLQLASMCFERPGGPSMAELLGTAVELAAASGGGALHDSSSIMQALLHVWQQPGVLALQHQPGGGDQRPDLAEHFLKLSTALVRHALPAAPSSTVVSLLDGSLCAAALCAGCCHRKVASSALGFTCGVLGAAAGDGPELQRLVQRRGRVVVAGLLRALLAPSPLPRVHKVTSALLELAGLLQQQQQQHGGGAAAGAGEEGGAAGGPPALLAKWLAEAVDGLPPSTLPAREAHNMVAQWAALLTQPPRSDAKAGQRQYTGVRSYMVSRRLKKQVREFAEQSAHQQAGGSCNGGSMAHA